MAFRPPAPYKLDVLREQWLAVERAVLENPNTPECERECSRKAIERLEGKCQDGQQKQPPLTTEN